MELREQLQIRLNAIYSLVLLSQEMSNDTQEEIDIFFDELKQILISSEKDTFDAMKNKTDGMPEELSKLLTQGGKTINEMEKEYSAAVSEVIEANKNTLLNYILLSRKS